MERSSSIALGQMDLQNFENGRPLTLRGNLDWRMMERSKNSLSGGPTLIRTKVHLLHHFRSRRFFAGSMEIGVSILHDGPE